MSRLFNRTTQLVIDIGLLSLGLWAAFFLRFEGAPPFQMFKRLVFVWPWVVTTQYGILALYGIPRFSWRFIGLREITRIFAALGTAAAILLFARTVAIELSRTSQYADYAMVPFGVIVIDFALVFMALSGARAIRRLTAERTESRARATSSVATPTILIGAGQAGVLVAKELGHRPELGMTPVAFLDDDPLKQGTVVHGVRVLGATDDLGAIAEQLDARQALITIANAPGKAIRRINELCREQGIPAKIIPGIYEIVGGQVNLSRIRELAIEDLLGREQVALDESALSKQLRRRVVLVTGAGGSIGSELCRQICRFGPAALVMVEQAENALFNIHREVAASHPTQAIVPCVADILDRTRIESLFETYRPDVVFHAAAHKHVPMMEWNPSEAIKNNVMGTRNLADVAHEREVEAFVMISTDKAVNPTSVMGASKRVAELYAQALSHHSDTRFVTVRFGNVLGSAGSVIPIFKEQILEGGPVRVTHPEMQRYFMTIPEASQLVMQAGTMGQGGEIFVLDMGEPVKIVDLARDLIRLSGFTPDDEIEIEFSGIRPGEKLFEELSVRDEDVDKTRHPKIFVGRGNARAMADVTAAIDMLTADVDTASEAELRARLQQVVPEYTPSAIAAPAGRTAQIPGARPRAIH